MRGLGWNWRYFSGNGGVYRRTLGIVVLTVSAIGCGSNTKPNPSQTNPLGDAGNSVTCKNDIAVVPSPNLTGRFALQTIASRFVPKTGLTSEFYTTTTSILLADLTQTGTQVSMSAAYCSQVAADPAAPAHVNIPDAYQRSLAPFVRTGTYSGNGTGTGILAFPSFVELEGVTLADPAHDALPTDPADPRVTDQDKDGNPGVTIKLSGLVSGDMYVVQRQTSALTGIAVSEDRVQGDYGFTSEQIVLASNPEAIKTLAAQTAIADPNTCASSFVLVRVTAASACADVLADATLFN